MLDRRRVTAALLAGAATSIIGAGKARAQTQPLTPARNVVLVHGLYADGSCWLRVIQLLQQVGLNVTAVQNPLRSLDEDCEFTRRTLTLQDGPTVLVAHSYGGEVAGATRRYRPWCTVRHVRLTRTRIIRRSPSPILPRRRARASFTPTAMFS